MTIWHETSVDWTTGVGSEVVRLYSVAYPTRSDLAYAADRAGVLDVDQADGWVEVLTRAAAQQRLLSLAAGLMHDDSRAVFHYSLRQLLGSDLDHAKAAQIAAYGLPRDADAVKALVSDRTAAALEQYGSFESFNAVGAGTDSVEARMRVFVDAKRRTALIRQGGVPAGTGFLVGDDLLLTAGHVLGGSPWPPTDVSAFEAIFDYREGPRSPDETGTRVPIARFLCGSLPTSQENRGAVNEPDAPADRLDFALVRLGWKIGLDADPGYSVRGWYQLPQPAYAYANATLLYLFGHTAGMVLQNTRTVGLIQANLSTTRLRYKTNTAPGSSGSPVIDERGRLVALHHYSAGGQNQGVPIWRIATALLASSYAPELNRPVPGSPPAQGLAAIQQAASPASAHQEPDPFTALEIGGRPIIDRNPLRTGMHELACGQGSRTMVITGEVDTGVSTSYDVLSHVADRSQLVPELIQVAPQGISAIRIDLRKYIKTEVALRRRAIMIEIYRWVEGNGVPEETMAQVAKDVENFGVWAANAFRSSHRQWWIFVDSIDVVAEVNQHGIDELLHVLLDLTKDYQFRLRVVLAGRQADQVEHEAVTWAVPDVAAGLPREEVNAWLQTLTQKQQPPVDAGRLETKLNELFPPGEPPRDPTKLQRAIAQAAAELRS
jgi:V8-like Glu-specific endopeptidase